jgi:hypothetical protein
VSHLFMGLFEESLQIELYGSPEVPQVPEKLGVAQFCGFSIRNVGHAS